MANTIVQRMEKLLSPIPPLQKPKERPPGVTTCSRQRRLRQMQAELCLHGSLTEAPHDPNAQRITREMRSLGSIVSGSQSAKGPVSIRELIAARIAQTEEIDGIARKSSTPCSNNDRNQTIINLNSLAASIYFWSPFGFDKEEERKSKLMPNRLRARTCALQSNTDNSYTHRNKDSFVNFSQAALTLVARNSETPTSTLKWLAAHHSKEVRKATARNENTDHETLALLCTDPDGDVKNAVLDNPKITRDLAAKLSNDKSINVSAKARNVYCMLDMQSKEPVSAPVTVKREKNILQSEREFLKVIADSASTCHRLLVKSAKQTESHVRMLVAGAPNATAEILWQLASNPISQVKRKLVDKYNNCLLETEVNLQGPERMTSENALVASETTTVSKVF